MGNGKTFVLHTRSSKPCGRRTPPPWYATNAAGGDPSQWFWENALADGFGVTGGGFNDPANRWIFYLDADPACGQATGGTSGVALLPANDLRGLTGQPNMPVCPGQAPDLGGVPRWIGARPRTGPCFGPPAPARCEMATQTPSVRARASSCGRANAVYPATSLLQTDRDFLNASSFFVKDTASAPDAATAFAAALYRDVLNRPPDQAV